MVSIFLYKFTRIKIKSFEFPLSIRNYKKDNAWNIRCLVDDLSQQTSEPAYYILDWRIFGPSNVEYKGRVTSTVHILQARPIYQNNCRLPNIILNFNKKTYVIVQQTPNPAAQLPSAVPPLFKVIIEKSHGGRFLWNRNWDLGWIWAECRDISPVSNMILWIFLWIFAWFYPKISACCSLRNLG